MRGASLALAATLVGCAVTVSPSAPEPGCARAPDVLRALRPLTGARMATSSPTFRWRTSAPLRALRLLLCEDRACETVRWSEAVSGERARLGRSLAPGVYFWQLRGRDGVDRELRSASRALVIVDRGGASACPDTLTDFNGDGVEDLVTLAANTARVRYGGGALDDAVIAPDDDPGPCGAGSRVSSFSLAGAGDVDGDGFTDAALYETRVERRCEGGGEVYARRFGLLSGGARGLRGAIAWRPTQRASVPWVTGRVDAVGDADDDGYADLAESRVSERQDRCAPDFGSYLWFGAPGLCLQRSASALSAPGGVTTVCDVDGDALEELAVRDGTSVFGLYRATERRLRPIPLPARCGGVDLHFYDRCIPGVERPEADVRPLGDLDGDGLTDVVSELFDRPNATGPRGAVTFFGAPGGFREDRCALRR